MLLTRKLMPPPETPRRAAANRRSPHRLTATLTARLLLWLTLLLPLSLGADDSPPLPTQQLTPGGVAIVPLDSQAQQRPSSYYNDKQVAVIRTDSGWQAVVGIPLLTPAGEQSLLTLDGNGRISEQHFNVDALDYPEQHLTIKNPRKVNPNEEDMQRIRRDRTSIAKAKRYRHPTMLGTRFDLPVQGIKSSSFGSRRFFNKQPRRPHGGMDIAAVEGTPIYAPADAYVIETGDYFFSGNCIFLGHGQGLQTFYAHLSKIDVSPGEQIKRGQKIGEVGATGRVTGAHLHWSVGLNQTWVDPNLFLNARDQTPATE